MDTFHVGSYRAGSRASLNDGVWDRIEGFDMSGTTTQPQEQDGSVILIQVFTVARCYVSGRKVGTTKCTHTVFNEVSSIHLTLPVLW